MADSSDAADKDKTTGLTAEQLAAIAKAVATQLSGEKPPAVPNTRDFDERVRQVLAEKQRQHEEELEKVRARSNIRLAEVVRLRRNEAAQQALRDAGFRKALKLMTPQLVNELDVIEDEKSTDNPFRTVVRGAGGVERVTVGKDKTDAHPMTPMERAMEMAIDPEWKGYLDVDTNKDKNKLKLPANVVIPSQQYIPAQNAGQQEQMSVIEELVLARGGSL